MTEDVSLRSKRSAHTVVPSDGYLARVLKVFSFDCGNESVSWRLTSEGEIQFYALCSDFFWWGTADLEDIAPVDLPMLEQAAADLGSVPSGINYVGELFCARKRGMRPQGAYYKHLPKGSWPLFDACGPERERSLTNPKVQPPSSVHEGNPDR